MLVTKHSRKEYKPVESFKDKFSKTLYKASIKGYIDKYEAEYPLKEIAKELKIPYHVASRNFPRLSVKKKAGKLEFYST